MPQYSPMNWMLIYFTFIVFIIVISTKIHFSSNLK